MRIDDRAGYPYSLTAMKIATDLHIHSVLSPCGDADMTPNNIIGMAVLKELDAIAVADHNSALNLPACAALAEQTGILLVPAIEVQTREEVHVLCYLPTVPAALELSNALHKSLVIQNNPEIFGDQLVLDENDEIIGREEPLLIQSVDYSLEELVRCVRQMGGASVPAHINRQANSIIYALGFIPPGLFTSVEVSKLAPMPAADLAAYHVLYSSDAHDLGGIYERENFIPVENASVESVLAYLNSPKA